MILDRSSCRRKWYVMPSESCEPRKMGERLLFIPRSWTTTTALPRRPHRHSVRSRSVQWINTMVCKELQHLIGSMHEQACVVSLHPRPKWAQVGPSAPWLGGDLARPGRRCEPPLRLFAGQSSGRRKR